MKITEKTKVKEVLEAYPWIQDELTKMYPKLEVLKAPIASILIENADIKKVSEKTGVEVEEIIRRIEILIERKG